MYAGNYKNPLINILKRKYLPKASIQKKGAAHHYRRSTPPISVPLNKLFSNNFPLSLRESIADYQERNNILQFQHNLLSRLPFYPNHDATGRFSEVLQTDIGSNRYINEFVIYPNKKTKENYQNAKHLIMVHGYGSGLGLYLKNFEGITQDNWVIHAIDLLGYGGSSRPDFTAKNLHEVEDWFHLLFEKWMQKRGISSENTLVMAHSMGAYLMASYGIRKDPNFCHKLIMVSPGGIKNHKKEVAIPKYFERLWERNISPFSLVRNASIYGSKLVSAWTYRRFANLPKRERDLLHKYVYAIFQAKGSGEYMLNFLLKPGANPRHPLVERGVDKCNFDFSWWYGKEDWMNVEGGIDCSEQLRKAGRQSDVYEFENSGHHIYLDNITKFNEMLVEEMKEMDKKIELDEKPARLRQEN